MRCLYCGKPLPLLKKLTGGGEFCSDAHRHKYQEEYNKLALSRLLQAQAPAGEGAPPRGPRQLPPPGGLRPGQRALPPPATRQLAAPAAQPASASAPPPSFNPFEPPSAPVPTLSPPRPTAPPPLPPPAAPVAPPQADPPFASFRLDPVPPAKMEGSSNVPGVEPAPPEFISEEAATKVDLRLESGLEAHAFDWQATQERFEDSGIPDPPEAAPWEHPIAFAVPVKIPELLALNAEFTPVFAYPVLGEIDLQIRYPAPVNRKVPMQAAERSPLAPGRPERLEGREWNVSLGLPAWKPRLPVILAPAVGTAPVVAAALEIPLPQPSATDAVEAQAGIAGSIPSPAEMPAPVDVHYAEAPAIEKVQERTAEAAPQQEVYIDLAILEMLEGKSPAAPRRW